MADNSKKLSNLNPGRDPIEPAVTPPSTNTETNFLRKPKLGESKSKKRDIPKGLWNRCDQCGNMIYDKELAENVHVCTHCGKHFPIGALHRIESLVDANSFREINAGLTSVDSLKFTGVASYESKLEKYRATTGLCEAVLTGTAKIDGHAVALAVMDFGFLAGSMGSVVGEKITRLIEAGTSKKLPVIIISASGGARMYEGMFSLMQMAKTCGALAYHAREKLPYISVLTHPTTAGVMASYAGVGDLIIAEPGAMICFAGPRVIEVTTQAELPPGFQTSEFLMKHGLIDAIVPRREMRARLAAYLGFLTPPKKKPARRKKAA